MTEKKRMAELRKRVKSHHEYCVEHHWNSIIMVSAEEAMLLFNRIDELEAVLAALRNGHWDTRFEPANGDRAEKDVVEVDRKVFALVDKKWKRKK